MQSVTFSSELIRLVVAAVISPDFCDLLLADPALAISAGYRGTSFQLSHKEREIVCSISATSLPDFTNQLIGAYRNRVVSHFMVNRDRGV